MRGKTVSISNRSRETSRISADMSPNKMRNSTQLTFDSKQSSVSKD
jgi:hypothetical protein